MKQAKDKFTRDASETPFKGISHMRVAKTPAQRLKEYRAQVQARKFDFLRGSRNEF